jgi:hypothetical protein
VRNGRRLCKFGRFFVPLNGPTFILLGIVPRGYPVPCSVFRFRAVSAYSIRLKCLIQSSEVRSSAVKTIPFTFAVAVQRLL